MSFVQEQRPITMAQLKDHFEQGPEEVSTEISPADGMYEGDRDHYFRVGQSALRCIKLAMLAEAKDDFRTILDFGCGYGRVLRTLQAAFPEARLTACDLVRDGADFCARHFGATPLYATKDPSRISADGPFDLIWCGTLLTNLNRDRWAELLELFHSLLGTGGVLVFTTHGPWVVQRIRSRSCTYGLEESHLPGLIDDYDRDGFGYRDYPPEVLRHAHIDGEYGISLTSPAWVCSQLEKWSDLRLLTYTERLWDDHQDVVACTREKS